MNTETELKVLASQKVSLHQYEVRIVTGAQVKAQELSCFSKLLSLNVAITAKHSSAVSFRG